MSGHEMGSGRPTRCRSVSAPLATVAVSANKGGKAARYFGDSPSMDSRACQIWQILVGCAARRETKKYQDLCELLSHSQPKVLAKQLGRIIYYCSRNKLPPLTVLIVNKNTGKPGDGLALSADRGKLRERVCQEDWFSIVPPTVEDYAEAWENR
jgi:hypothetical protein